MNSRITLLAIALTAMATVLSGCSTTVSDFGEAARVELWIGPQLQGTGSGVVIHSSVDHGTYVLTAAHVIGRMVTEKERLVGLLIPGSATITFEDGSRRGGAVVGAKWNRVKGKWIDLALIHVPYEDRVYTATEGISTDGVQFGERVAIRAIAPRDSAHVKRGRGAADVPGMYATSVLVEEPVVGGNSGSPVYEEQTGLLAAVLWGKGQFETDEDVFYLGYTTNSTEVIELIDELDLEFILD